MKVQVIERDGEPEYAVVPWAQYQALLRAAGHAVEAPAGRAPVTGAGRPALDRLGALREAKGLSVEALSRTVGISPHYLGMIERGERLPDAAILRSLAWELGIEGWEPAP